jgi:hypothetical protein
VDDPGIRLLTQDVMRQPTMQQLVDTGIYLSIYLSI